MPDKGSCLRRGAVMNVIALENLYLHRGKRKRNLPALPYPYVSSSFEFIRAHLEKPVECGKKTGDAPPYAKTLRRGRRQTPVRKKTEDGKNAEG